MKVKENSIIPVFGVIGAFTFLFGIVLFLYSFYKKELNEAIYTSVLTETKKRLETKVSSVFGLIERESRVMNKTLKETLKENVDNAYLMSYSIYSYCKKRKCPDSVIKLLIKKSLENYRFWHGKGYIFIDELKGKVFLNPLFPQIEGKSLWNWEDLKGTFVHRKFAEIALYSPDNEGFITYYWYKPGTKKETKKFAFVKLFKPYGWIIGGTVYAYQVEDELKKHVFNVGKAFNAFIISYKELSKFPFLRNLNLEQLKNGVFLTYRDRFYFVSYYPKWKWIVGAYVPNSELLQQVYYLRQQFLINANKILLFSTVFILAIIVLASVSLFKYNSKLNEIIEKLRSSKRELLRLTRSLRLTAYRDDVSGLSNRK
ncbi:cache domain-containing protein, partial [Thermovibrio sp.]